jgi:hypothetical protein
MGIDAEILNLNEEQKLINKRLAKVLADGIENRID